MRIALPLPICRIGRTELGRNSYYSVASAIGSNREKKYEFEGAEKQDRLLAIWTTKQTLSIEVKNLETKVRETVNVCLN